MRKVKVESVELNRGKFEKLDAVAEAYAKENRLTSTGISAAKILLTPAATVTDVTA